MSKRFPFRYVKTSPEVIAWRLSYIWFPLSPRNFEDLVHERGIEFSHETVRFWWNTFRPVFAAEIRRRRVDQMRTFGQWRWHLDEMYVRVIGDVHYLWRAFDHEGEF